MQTAVRMATSWSVYSLHLLIYLVVQYVGPIADLLVKDVQGKVAELRDQGKAAHYLVMDGQDTARVLLAYGKL